MSPEHAPTPSSKATRAKSPPVTQTKYPQTKSPRAKSPQAKSPPKSPEPKPLPPLPTTETPATSGDADYDLPQEYLYQVLYDYTAANASELTIKEGEMVISVAAFTPDISPGWLMVRHEGELEEGWVPESYLKNLGAVYEAEPAASGSGQTTGQAPPSGNQNPVCKSYCMYVHVHVFTAQPSSYVWWTRKRGHLG